MLGLMDMPSTNATGNLIELYMPTTAIGNHPQRESLALYMSQRSERELVVRSAIAK